MDLKRIQLAHLYQGDRFMGYGIAVDGVLLEKQLNTTVRTLPFEAPIIEVHFDLTEEMKSDNLRIQLPK